MALSAGGFVSCVLCYVLGSRSGSAKESVKDIRGRRKQRFLCLWKKYAERAVQTRVAQGRPCPSGVRAALPGRPSRVLPMGSAARRRTCELLGKTHKPRSLNEEEQCPISHFSKAYFPNLKSWLIKCSFL